VIPRVGSELDAYCTRCKMDLLHRVVAVVEARPKRVECLTCHSQHNYRKIKGAPRSTRAKTTTKSATAKAAPGQRAKRLTKGEIELAAQWETRVGGKTKGDFARYSVKQAFSVDQLLEHATFGQGYVSEVHQDRKISVVFRDGEKVLAHARG